MSLKINMREFTEWYKEYFDTCENRYKVSLESFEKERICIKSDIKILFEIWMQSRDQKIKEINEKIKQKTDQLVKIEEKIEKMTTIKEEIDSETFRLSAKKTYEKLKKHLLINKICLDLDKLVIITKKLKVKNNNIGHFEITYSLKNNNIRIKNLEYRVDNIFDHWHIRDTEPCLAEWKIILWKHLDTFQLFFFIDSILHYLLLSDSTHAYMKFDEWMEKFKNKKPLREINSVSSTEITIRSGWVSVSTVSPGYAYWTNDST